MVNLGTIFEKSRRSRVILKINGASPQLDQNLKPTRIFSAFITIVIYESRQDFSTGIEGSLGTFLSKPK